LIDENDSNRKSRPHKPALSSFQRGGWEVFRVTNERLQVDVLPSKGADIIGIRWLPGDIELLWTSPWALRDKNAASEAANSVERFLEMYPGGWQTIFPNGGNESLLNGVMQPFHGEACMVTWEVEDPSLTEDPSITMSTQLSLSPFSLRKTVSLGGRDVIVTETITNVSDESQSVMWSHHPAFGTPLISSEATIQCSAKNFVVDDERDEPNGDLLPGAITRWPNAATRHGSNADLSLLPGQDQPSDRFGYLTDFDEAEVVIENAVLGLGVRLRWDLDVFPHAWYWLEAHATQGFPWFGEAFVFAVEPASSYPGQGIENVTEKTGTQLVFGPQETKTQTISLSCFETS
jgi:galactose mutarotase-like enzyme